MFDITYAAKEMTKEVRKSNEIRTEDGMIILDDIIYKYNRDNQSIEKMESFLAVIYKIFKEF
ncbi:hypothetical protein ACI2OX_08670 [Bacillus sp. N9]